MSNVSTRLYITSALDSLDHLGKSMLTVNLRHEETEALIEQYREVKSTLHRALKAINETPVNMPDQVSALVADVERLMAAPVPGSNVVQLDARRQ